MQAHNAYLAIFTDDFRRETLAVKGSCDETEHKDWIEVEEFEYGMDLHNNIEESGEPALHSPFSIKKLIDRATPALAANCAQGQKPIGNIVFELCSASATKICELRVEMWNCYITSLSVSGRDLGVKDGLLPAEDVAFTFDRINWHYRPRDIPKPNEDGTKAPTRYSADGSGHGWDIKGKVATATI